MSEIIINKTDLAERIERLIKEEARLLHHREVVEALDLAKHQYMSIRGTYCS